ncbi:hypothetical protein [Streptomyces hygroscopicus]|uniref:hypothetical protein n=1 Tax=Streptomyces hygroscopicus TaxID=1912 RepID=UPI00223F7CFA|nr:hypothetical protein [Streptomyces hygroscopicus]
MRILGNHALCQDPAAARPERAARAATALAAVGRRVVVTRGHGEREPTAKVAWTHGRGLGRVMDPRQPTGVPAGSRGAVADGTGPAGPAAAAGTPVVSLFAPVVPAERRRPFGVPHVLLGDRTAAGTSSRTRHCPASGRPCPEGTSDAAVLAVMTTLCEERPAGTGNSPPARGTRRAHPDADASPRPCEVPAPGGGPETERGATV